MRLFAITTCILASCFNTLRAQEPRPVDSAALRQVEKRLRAALSNIDQVNFAYSKEQPNTLVVSYQTRTFMIHSQSRGGQYSRRPQETIGPSYRGFQLHLTIQGAEAVNTAVAPQTIQRPYWMTDLDIRLLDGKNSQLYCRLARGNRLDKDLLKRVRKAIVELGKAPYLKSDDRPKR